MNELTLQNIKKAHTLSNKDIKHSFVKYKNIYELLLERKNDSAGNEYISFYNENNEKVSLLYNEFIKKVFKLSNFLLENDIIKEDRVATYSHNHIDTVILYYACWTLGAVIVPINVNENIDRTKYILENSNSKLIFTRNNYVGKIKEINCPICRIINFDESKFDNYSDVVNIDFEIDKETEAMIVYTSGTTGNPKGVVLTQYNLIVDADNIAKWHRLYKNDTMMCILPIHHVNGTVVTIMTTMYYGGRLILNQKFQTETFFKRLSDEKVKVVSVVPTILQFLIHSIDSISEYNFEKFSHIICGAGPLTCELAKKFEEKFELRIIHGYGLSETTCYSCFIPVDLSPEEHKFWQNGFSFPSIGIPLECNEMEIHNEQGDSLKENERGEIVVRGHNVMKYYFNNDVANSETFKYGWFRSGDEGFFKLDKFGNKYFFITGRIKELIIRGGINISPLEIDEILSSIEFIKSAIAVGFENDWYGEEVGALVLLEDNYKESDELKKIILEKCKEKLSYYKCPKVIIFSDDIPVTSTGKYQRNKVKHLFSEFKKTQFK